MFKNPIIAGALLASLACATFVSAQSVREKAVKAAYQGPDAKYLKINGKAYTVKKANVRLGPGTRIVDGKILYFMRTPFPRSLNTSYTMVFRRDGTLVEVTMHGATSTGVYNAVHKNSSTGDLLDGSWQGSVRYLVAEIGLAVPKDFAGTPIPPGQPFPSPGTELPPVGDVMDSDEGGYETGDEDDNESGDNLGQQSYFLGASTSLVKVPNGQSHGHNHSGGQQRFGGDSYGHRINSVVPDSPATRARLEPGDIIISADQKPMSQQNSLSRAVAESNGQLDLILRNVRNGQSVAVVVELDVQTSTFKGTRSRRSR